MALPGSLCTAGPIWPVMDSRGLSAASFRFLDHRVPLGCCISLATDLLSYGRSPIFHRQSPSGFPRSARVRCDWGGCRLYSGVLVSSYRPGEMPVSCMCEKDHMILTHYHRLCYPSSPVTLANEASSTIHSRSPVQSFPSPVQADGLPSPWTLPWASHFAVTSDARQDWEQALDTYLAAVFLLLHSHRATSCRAFHC